MSIKSQMQDRAVAMAEAMAARARSPQEIEALRQRLVAQIQSGTIKPYVGVPLVEDLTKRLNTARQQMAQAAMGAPVPRGGPPIAEQVMAQAQEGAGVEGLPSNLPQSYAPGGLVAFAEGGDVERYQNQGYVSPTPAGRAIDAMLAGYEDIEEAGKLRAKLQGQYGPASAIPGLFMRQTDEEREAAKNITGLLPRLSLPQLRLLQEQGPSAVPTLVNQLATPATTPGAPAAPAARPAATPTGPAYQADARRMEGYAQGSTYTPPAIPPFVMPELNLPTAGAPIVKTMKYTQADMPAAVDVRAIVEAAPAKAKAALTEARDTEEKALRAMSEPGEAAREAKYASRAEALKKDAAISRALNIMSAGFGVAGSKERTLAGALGREGREGIQALIQGEAANRVAMERLEDARDNFEQQKIAARKGDRAAANAAGQRAADDVRAYTGLTAQAAIAGNADALQRYTAQEAAEQFRVGETNRNAFAQAGLQQQAAATAQQGALGVMGLQMQYANLAQQGLIQNALIGQNEKRIAAMDRSTQARYAQVKAGAMAKYDAGPGMSLGMQLAKQYGENWRTGEDARSRMAQMLYRQDRQSYLMDALGRADLMETGARDASEL